MHFKITIPEFELIRSPRPVPASNDDPAWLPLLPPIPWASLTAMSCLILAMHVLRPIWLPDTMGPVYPTFRFVCWNLFLGWLPLGFALLVACSRGSLWSWTGAAGWLLFLPNAFYMFTDLVHLRGGSSTIGFYDLSLLFLFGLHGLVLGIYAMRVVQFRLLVWHPGAGGIWAIRTIALLAGVGVWLGRIFRWNSWDALFHPLAILHDAFAHARSAEMWGLGLLTGLIIIAVYRMLFFPFEG